MLAASDNLDHTEVAAMLATAGLTGKFQLHPLPGGANNRVFRVEVNDARVLLKSYFRHRHDSRDRLQSEFWFSQTAWQSGIRCIPEPLAADPESRLALFQFISGEPFSVGDVQAAQIDSACQFVSDLNQVDCRERADDLPNASDACFSIFEHLQHVRRRIETLRCLKSESAAHQHAAKLVASQLVPAWQSVAARVSTRCPNNEIHTDLEAKQRCLSPSDFGFHNAIRLPDGTPRFIDFEYAGWDDPAKLVCDFFCQIQVPVPASFRERFLESVASLWPDGDSIRNRVRLLFPVYQIKWCCIVLNSFLPVGGQRRSFSAGGASLATHFEQQLATAEQLLQRLKFDKSASEWD